MENIVNLLGWLGAILYLVAYYLVSVKKLAGDSNLFQAMNIVAGFFLVINSAWYTAWPGVALNALWACIGIYTIGRNIYKRYARNSLP